MANETKSQKGFQSGRAVGVKVDHVQYELGTPAQLMQKCITYSSRRFCAIKILENIKTTPGSTQPEHLQECKESPNIGKLLHENLGFCIMKRRF